MDHLTMPVAAESYQPVQGYDPSNSLILSSISHQVIKMV
jgi:hypothetical protein